MLARASAAASKSTMGFFGKKKRDKTATTTSLSSSSSSKVTTISTTPTSSQYHPPTPPAVASSQQPATPSQQESSSSSTPSLPYFPPPRTTGFFVEVDNDTDKQEQETNEDADFVAGCGTNASSPSSSKEKEATSTHTESGGAGGGGGVLESNFDAAWANFATHNNNNNKSSSLQQGQEKDAGDDDDGEDEDEDLPGTPRRSHVQTPPRQVATKPLPLSLAMPDPVTTITTTAAAAAAPPPPRGIETSQLPPPSPSSSPSPRRASIGAAGSLLLNSIRRGGGGGRGSPNIHNNNNNNKTTTSMVSRTSLLDHGTTNDAPSDEGGGRLLRTSSSRSDRGSDRRRSSGGPVPPTSVVGMTQRKRSNESLDATPDDNTLSTNRSNDSFTLGTKDEDGGGDTLIVASHLGNEYAQQQLQQWKDASEHGPLVIRLLAILLALAVIATSIGPMVFLYHGWNIGRVICAFHAVHLCFWILVLEVLRTNNATTSSKLADSDKKQASTSCCCNCWTQCWDTILVWPSRRACLRYVSGLRLLWGRGLLWIMVGSLNIGTGHWTTLVSGGLFILLGVIAIISGSISVYRLNMLTVALTDDAFLWTQFGAVDRDQDGTIDLKEFAELVASLGLSLDFVHAQDVFREMDAQNTQKNGRINFHEFKSWWFQEHTYPETMCFPEFCGGAVEDYVNAGDGYGGAGVNV